MFKCETDEFKYEFDNYKRVQLFEAMCRGCRDDYIITFPDGGILECKFK
jgi:hypothetical protein